MNITQVSNKGPYVSDFRSKFSKLRIWASIFSSTDLSNKVPFKLDTEDIFKSLFICFCI